MAQSLNARHIVELLVKLNSADNIDGDITRSIVDLDINPVVDSEGNLLRRLPDIGEHSPPVGHSPWHSILRRFDSDLPLSRNDFNKKHPER